MNRKLLILAMGVCASSALATDMGIGNQLKNVDCHKKHAKHNPDKMFDKMDLNKDSLISKEEFLRVYNERKTRHSKKCKRK